jgi:formylglycine-generating enzyme required for sulfatase activity
MFPLPAGVDEMALTGGWVVLPGGDFEMGSPPGEAGRDNDEVLHRVWLSPFVLGEAEVTARQFRRLVPEHRLEDGDELPARAVSWYAAVAFAAWAGARLPTEAEWEFGSRWRGEGSPLATMRYCAGDDVADLARVGWYGNSGRGAHPIKQKAACGGLYDLHGNAAEWVADRYAPYSPATGGAAVADPAGPPTGVERVIRGGSFGAGADFARSAGRSGRKPGHRDVGIGFRLARPNPSSGLDH